MSALVGYHDIIQLLTITNFSSRALRVSSQKTRELVQQFFLWVARANASGRQEERIACGNLYRVAHKITTYRKIIMI